MIYGGPIETTPDAAFLELVEVNLTALQGLARLLPALKANGGGSMIHIASYTDPRHPGSLPYIGH